MPTYTYECEFCKKREDHVYPIDSAPAMMKCMTALNHWARRIITLNAGFKMDRGRLFSHAFGKEFKNEKDLNDYAKHHGHIAVGNASAESVHSWDRQTQSDNEEKRFKEMLEPVQWE